MDTFIFQVFKILWENKCTHCHRVYLRNIVVYKKVNFIAVNVVALPDEGYTIYQWRRVVFFLGGAENLERY